MQSAPVKEAKVKSHAGNVPDSLLAVPMVICPNCLQKTSGDHCQRCKYPILRQVWKMPMVRCPNCGQKTSGDHCQWCKYPILKGRLPRLEETEERARKEAEQLAKAQAKRDAEEARKAEETEERARKEAEETAELYEGIVKLTMVSPGDVRQMTKLQEYLCQVQDLRLVWYGSSVD